MWLNFLVLVRSKAAAFCTSGRLFIVGFGKPENVH